MDGGTFVEQAMFKYKWYPWPSSQNSSNLYIRNSVLTLMSFISLWGIFFLEKIEYYCLKNIYV